MADTVSSIQASGGDYTTIQAWEDDTNVSAGRWIGEIDDTREYLNENLTFSGGTGTPDADNFSWLRVPTVNKHVGIPGSGHARIRDTAGHVVTLNRAFTVIEGLEVTQDGTGASDECFRIDADECLFSRIIGKTTTTSDQDVFYSASNAGITIYCDNCLVTQAGRAGWHSQGGTTALTFNVDSCSCIDAGASGGVTEACFRSGLASGETTNFNIFNSYGFLDSGAAGSTVVFFASSTGTTNWGGTNNIAEDTTAEDKFTSSFDSVVLIDTDPVSGENVHVDSISGEDFNITDEDTETVTQNGVDRSATHPAPQTTDGTIKVQDLSTDIADVSRSGFSIGPFEFVAAAGGRIMSSLAYHGGLAGKGGIAGAAGGLAG